MSDTFDSVSAPLGSVHIEILAITCITINGHVSIFVRCLLLEMLSLRSTVCMIT